MNKELINEMKRNGGISEGSDERVNKLILDCSSHVRSLERTMSLNIEKTAKAISKDRTVSYKKLDKLKKEYSKILEVSIALEKLLKEA